MFLLEQQQLWHLDCQLWRSWAIYPNAKTLGLSDMLTHSPELDLVVAQIMMSSYPYVVLINILLTS